MVHNKAILSLTACALATAMTCQALAQSNDDLATKDDLARLKRLEERVAGIEAAIKQGGEKPAAKNGKESRGGKDSDDGKEPDEKQKERSTPVDKVQLDSMEDYIVKYTNAYREKQGLPALTLDAKLSKASKGHSGDMQRLNFFSHHSPLPGKTRFFHRAEKCGTTAAAENIARGAENGKAALELWLNSAGHRKNIVGDYRRIGVGRNGDYYTQMFGK